MKNKKKPKQEISDYDETDTSKWIDATKPLHFSDLGLRLPAAPPTQVVSIRLPSRLLNRIRAYGSEHDVPYQALIKLWLTQAVEKASKKKAA